MCVVLSGQLEVVVTQISW